MKRILTLALCSFASMGLFAAETTDTTAVAKGKADKYTFSDFFDALDLPCVFGVSCNNKGLEKPGMITFFRLGWRQHKNYGWCTYITYDFHIHEYENLAIPSTNIRSGEITYNEIGWSVGYRIPIVKNLKQFYANPELKPFDFYLTFDPVVSFASVQHVDEYTDATSGETYYTTVNDPAVVIPSLRLTAGFEWLVVHNLGIFIETSFIQHCTATGLEQAAINNGTISTPYGQGSIAMGLAMFFK